MQHDGDLRVEHWNGLCKKECLSLEVFKNGLNECPLGRTYHTWTCRRPDD